MKSVEDRLRAIETAVRKLEDDHWTTSNPEKKARSEGLAAQLEAAIAELEADLEKARAAKNAAKISELTDALDARRSWLAAVDN